MFFSLQLKWWVPRVKKSWNVFNFYLITLFFDFCLCLIKYLLEDKGSSWDKVFKRGCLPQTYLVHSWIRCRRCNYWSSRNLLIIHSDVFFEGASQKSEVRYFHPQKTRNSTRKCIRHHLLPGYSLKPFKILRKSYNLAQFDVIRPSLISFLEF